MTYRAYPVEAGEAKNAAIVATLHARLFPKLIFPYPHYGDWWVVWHGEEPVAFAHMSPTLYYPNTGYFGRVGVLPEHRGHGLQARLMKMAEWTARKVHAWEALVSDTTRNPHSAANFIRCGWSEFEPEEAHRKGWAVNRYTKFWRKGL
jgi:GNAT superfamily N-acetyltransferase